MCCIIHIFESVSLKFLAITLNMNQTQNWPPFPHFSRKYLVMLWIANRGFRPFMLKTTCHWVKCCLVFIISIVRPFYIHWFWLRIAPIMGSRRVWQVDSGCLLLLDTWSYLYYIQGSMFSQPTEDLWNWSMFTYELDSNVHLFIGQ